MAMGPDDDDGRNASDKMEASATDTAPLSTRSQSRSSTPSRRKATRGGSTARMLHSNEDSESTLATTMAPHDGVALAGWGEVDMDHLLQNNNDNRNSGGGGNRSTSEHEADPSRPLGVGERAMSPVTTRATAALVALAVPRSEVMPREVPAKPEMIALRPRSLTAVDFAPSCSSYNASSGGSGDGMGVGMGMDMGGAVVPTKRMHFTAHRQSRRRGDDEDALLLLPRIQTAPRALTTSHTNANATCIGMSGGLFGVHITDSLATRGELFAHLRPLWLLQLTSTRRSMAVPTISVVEASMVLLKVARAVGIVLQGDAVSASSLAAAVHGHAENGADVGFDAFCDVLVRNAIQPTMHHFALDRSGLDAYAQALDTIVRAILIDDEKETTGTASKSCFEMTPSTSTSTSTSLPPSPLPSSLLSQDADTPTGTGAQWRLRELREIQPVLPHWKKERRATALLRVRPPVQATAASPRGATIAYFAAASPLASPSQQRSRRLVEEDGETICEKDRVREMTRTRTLAQPPSLGRDEEVDQLLRQRLPQGQARMQQDANLRRKLQLRQSWQPRVLLVGTQQRGGDALDGVRGSLLCGSRNGTGGGGAGSSSSVVTASSFSSSSSSSSASNAHTSAARVTATARSSTRVEAVQVDYFARPSCPADDHGHMDRESDPDDRVLLCGGHDHEDCHEDATLWCASCFAVFCGSCWTCVHHSVVDTSGHEVSLSLSLTTRAVGSRGDPSDGHRAPTPMVYLSTKPLARGKLARGVTTMTPPHQQGGQSNASDRGRKEEEEGEEEEEGDGDGDQQTPWSKRDTSSLMPVASGVLPVLRPPRAVSRLRQRMTDHQSMPELPSDERENIATDTSTVNLLRALMLGSTSSVSMLGSSASAPPSAWGSSMSPVSQNSKDTSGKNDRVASLMAKRRVLPTTAVTLDANALLT